MPAEITAYKCAYCNKISRTKSGILNHETHCRYNPTNRFCHTCMHCDMKGLISTEECCYTGEKYEIRGMYCNHYGAPIVKGEEAVYFRECDTEDNNGWGPVRNAPCSCFYYEAKTVKEDT